MGVHNMVSWEQHFQQLVNPSLMTRLLHRAIPVLRHVNWRVASVGDGYCKTVLPLNEESTNQHGTHQAALMSLSADYTGGLALASLLRGIPLAGVHKCAAEESASLWLAQMNVKYKRPSAGHLDVECRVAPEQARNIQERYARGDRVLAPLNVDFLSDGQQVAVAEMKYFAQPTSQLEPSEAAPRRSALFEHKLKASARMIAGLRTLKSSSPRVHVDCPLAGIAAGPHGLLLANKLQALLPQLKEMVLARTQHIDETIGRVAGLKQVVLLGAGLDMRPMRLASEYPDVRFFEVDLPEMLAERRRVCSGLIDDYSGCRFEVEADFKSTDLLELFSNHPHFDRTVPTAIIYEGCSMYFSDAENRKTLGAMAQLVDHPDSVLWADFVSEEVSGGEVLHDGIRQFLDGMTEMGESFRFGLDAPASWARSAGFEFARVTSSSEVLGENDSVYEQYRFAELKR